MMMIMCGLMALNDDLSTRAGRPSSFFYEHADVFPNTSWKAFIVRECVFYIFSSTCLQAPILYEDVFDRSPSTCRKAFILNECIVERSG